MIGITSYGAYIPWNRIERQQLAKAWGGLGVGEKAIAYYDEDSVTMAVEAAIDCLRGAWMPIKLMASILLLPAPPIRRRLVLPRWLWLCTCAETSGLPT